MATKPKQIRFEEDGFDDWSDSPESPSRSPTPSVSSFQRDSRPKRGTTRIPSRIVSKRALIHLGYSFAEDGDTIVVQLALGQNHIEELLELSNRIRSSDQGTSEVGDSGETGPRDEDQGFDWINVNAPDTETPHLETGEIGDFSGNEDEEPTLDDTDWDWDNLEGPVIYSGVLNLNSTKSSMDNDMNSTAGKLLAWNQEKSDLINGAKTELNTAYAAEFYMDRAGNQKITLACPEDYEFGATDESLVRLRWLHVQSESLNVATMETLISDCPYISQSLRLVALTVLKEVTAKCERSSENGSYLEPGSMIQYIGRYNSSLGVYADEDASDTEPVVFISSSHLLLTDRRSAKKFPGKHYMRSLREVLYGYDDETQPNNDSRGRNFKLDEDGPPKLKVPQIWTLIVGADLIVTFSELLSPEIQQNLIKIDRTKSSAGLYTVRLINEQDMCRYHVVVKADWKYADFLKHAVALALKGQGPVNAAAYVLVNDYWGIITADIWLNLLASETIEDYVFGIREKHEAQRRPNEEFLALSEKLLTAGSRSNLGSRRASRRRSDSRATNMNPIDMDMQMVLHPGDLNFVPFLAWRLTWDDDKRSQSEIEKTLTQLLGNLNATIESDRMGKWYKASFECTKGELTQRLASMLQLSPPKPTGEATEGVAQTNSRPDVNPGSNSVVDADLQEPDLKTSIEHEGSTESLVAPASTLFGSTENEENELDPKVQPNTHFRHPIHNSSSEDLRSGNDLWKLMDSKEDHESFLLSRIFSVSQSMLSAFLPDEGRLVHHPVYKRYWGSVDAILRGLQWSIDEMKGTDQLFWFITRPTTPFPPGESASISGSRALGDCDECDKVKRYLSPEEALDHWHKVHMRTPCLHQARGDRVFDDPCFVWIRRHTVEESRTVRSKEAPRNEVVSCLELFYEELLDMVDRTEELHKLVMSVTSLGDSVNCHDSRPHLPNSLVEAFERIVGLFVLKAKEISWMNRLTVTPDSLYGRHAERRLMDLKRNAAAISERVRNHLDRAKEDIILLGTSRGDMDRIIIAPIGPEFLAVALISNLQNNISKRGTNEKVDLISHYRNHTAKLRFNTNRKPKRQAFVEIHALEEELEALQMVVASQQGLLRAYQRLFSPLNFKYPTTDWIYYKERKSLFRLESKCVRRQQRRLAERDRALGVLRKKVRVLRDETKQRIEILDEGHGKAIRVFTIVTLFFLPLSFITSFFGMNTTDIRDTNYDQKIFWISALPVTFGVIGLAFLYGYKWDMIAGWANGMLRSADKSTAPHEFLNEEIPTWTSTAEPKDTWLPNHGRASVTGWRYRMSYLSARQRRRKGRVPRKKTDDSLFRP
ncbi:uncharacterized protein CCOS01_15038 [Colletotrichum costaricense]|uniref:DUF8035 domain-containing protein n=1 Tax=Colletotrichum costaricense TaxID=1209916 RepID=A0AAI9YI97_9PEZI|nr:uncharacterized protein CCOS01_15038 [Colletotrichum costaricense]KAK1511276.1 hypothetical protein CCOS01_15038 [Colletotrichum costaricense]